MQTHQQVWKCFQRHNVVSFVVRVSRVAVLGLLFLGAMLGVNVAGAHAQFSGSCSHNDRTYIVVGGDTLGGIAVRYGTTWQKLVSYNHIPDPNLIYVNETVCIPGHGSGGGGTSGAPSQPVTKGPGLPAVGKRNVFPYGTCTWWADERYHRMHGVYVPWTTNANAWQWTARAYDFKWHVSGTPKVGSIIDLQPWVEGASGRGHVGVVERVLANGHVIASSMSWGANPAAVTEAQFTPAPGVTFISR